ncbi:EcsC family protein [Luteimonas sp. RD2P54]|uniref:EcsC family protein n=1 Tax=Luteimonas endophytica TaxID=3042023 RepID=A0ABT6JBV1_9GAMM|nr:EcsC family protein [Luteimonas endophytica]MDH5824239.1 EcsC family protein [Luteimonas endophytica]
MHALVPLLSESDLQDLRRARRMLESPGLAAQLANAVGAPMEYVFARRLPAPVTRLINSTTRRALEQSLRFATATLDADARSQPARSGAHAAAVATTGALGGAFGLFGLVLELPVTTTVILRSIADIARSEGEDLADPGATLACFEVLTMGGRSARDEGAESGYFAARAVLAQQVATAAEYIAAHGLISNGAPAIVQLLAAIASRFSINVTKKVAVQSVPVIGAVSGAALNTLFMRHFQHMARGHFTVRRLERRVGAAAVREAYAALEREDVATA